MKTPGNTQTECGVTPRRDTNMHLAPDWLRGNTCAIHHRKRYELLLSMRIFFSFYLQCFMLLKAASQMSADRYS